MKFVPVVLAGLVSLAAAARPARIEWGKAFERDTLEQGAKIFSDRNYTFNLPPESLKGAHFLRGSIMGTRFRVVADGELVVLTPMFVPARNGHPPAASQGEALAKVGFKKDDGPLFQLWGKGEIEQGEIWRKSVKAGESYAFGKFAIPVGFDASSGLRATSSVAMETLYNGIRLESDPRDRSDMTAYRNYPLPVPYLDNPPAVIPVDVGRQLFIDDFLIAETTMARTWHKAQKDSRNPVMVPTTPLEKGELSGFAKPTEPMAAPFSGGVWFDGTDNLFKCWYCAGWFDGTGYAYSKDGYDWIRPNLRAVPGTNRVVPPAVVDGKRSRRDSAAVILDPDCTGGSRFKMLIWSRPQGGELFVSDNGLDWGKSTVWAPTGDRSTIFYNPFRKVWVYSIRSGWHDRSREYAESRDFLGGAGLENRVRWLRADSRDQPETSWIYSEPGNFDTDARAASLYNFDAVAYESLMLGAFTLMTGADNGDCSKRDHPKMTDIHLGFSRDGFHFSRAEDRSPFIVASRKAGTWDRGYLHSNAALCLVDGDELKFYYTGFAGKTGEYKDRAHNGIYSNASMGIARLRRDGFASMDAGSCGGTLVTRPIKFTQGDRLFVNANAAGGSLKAEILDEKGAVLSVSKDWSGNATKAEILGGLATLAGRTIRLRFTAKEAQLYAFWFSDASGRSRGYLAGGSPQHATLRD
ncbi:MAG: glycosyl hydrolase family 32 [bacterium]|nr:glycosyl hydrolase family 32 [bacterium]